MLVVEDLQQPDIQDGVLLVSHNTRKDVNLMVDERRVGFVVDRQHIRKAHCPKRMRPARLVSIVI